MNKINRIFFKDNPYPLGHEIKKFVWKGLLDKEKGLIFDINLKTDYYYADDDSDYDSDDDYLSDWRSRSSWMNYHRCSLYGEIVVGTPNSKFDFSKLNIVTVDTLPINPDHDYDDYSFHIYLLGHDSCANHKIIFTKNSLSNTYDICWTGKIALTYIGEEEFIHDFEANINNVIFSGIDFMFYDKDIENNKKLLESCVTDISIFKLTNNKFELTI